MGSAESVWVTRTSASGVSVLESVAVRSPESGSETPAGSATVAVLTSVPRADGRTSAVSV